MGDAAATFALATAPATFTLLITATSQHGGLAHGTLLLTVFELLFAVCMYAAIGIYSCEGKTWTCSGQ